MEMISIILISGCVSVKFSLRTFCLVSVYADEHVIRNLVAGCPLIEYLTIRSSDGFKSLEFNLNLLLLQYLSITSCCQLRSINIPSPSLKKLVINGYSLVEVKLETPNLSIFKFRGDAISFISNALALSETDLYVDSNSDHHLWQSLWMASSGFHLIWRLYS
ncbi:hypothetical protein Pint_19613 [Pistacia integerrima]|uniref:Uncharacterized protein n=1 Tax=Pistacia integerrima TaxID=434235 RepID=A0ACC0XAG6_9ROSI|nr:hypothetical protein Pint_19613 [Pistacia integerrima]